MKIAAYDEVDPLKVIYLTQLALDFPLTQERVAQIRNSDPRSFPCLALYAVEGEAVLGQAGIYRLPAISTAGREDVGSIWGFAMYPQYAGREVAALLMKEAHSQMRNAGMRFAALETGRNCLAYTLFQENGYEDTNLWATGLAHWETAHQPTRLSAIPAGPGDYELIEQLHQDIARDYLGFAWRFAPFAPLESLSLEELWVLQENDRPVGYALTRGDSTMLAIRNLVLRQGVDPAEAIAAVAAQIKSGYVQVVASRPVEIDSLRRAGFHLAQPSRRSLLIKPLTPGTTVEDARQLFGLGTDRFLISCLDFP